MKNIAALLALILLLGACASDGDAEGTNTTEAVSAAEGNDDPSSGSGDEDTAEANDGSDEDDGTEAAGGSDNESSDGDASSEDEGDNTGDDSTGNDSTSSGGEAGSELSPNSALGFILATIDVEPTDEIMSCIQDEGADPQTEFDAAGADATAISLATIKCLPDELSAFGASTYPTTPGVESDDVECVLQEAYGYIGELSQAEAEAVVDSTVLSSDIEAEIVGRATDRCGVTEDVALGILDFLAS